jgi:glycosyltransferase involved in cell wall biosynthesis
VSAALTSLDAGSVLMLSPQFRPVVGGYERAAERLSRTLAAGSWRVALITERRHRAWPPRERGEGFDILRLPCVHRRHLHLLTSLASWAAFLLRHGREFDLWHVHQYGAHAGLAVALGRLLNRPVVLNLTSTGTMGIARVTGRGIMGWILPALHRRVDACIAVSDETRAEAVGFGIPPARVHLAPFGVDGAEFRAASPEERIQARRALGLDCERLVLYVGRLAPEKNPAGLLEAWAAIDATARRGTLLALVGGGPEASRVRELAEAPALAGHVHLAGERSDVAAWYRAADVYVLPSSREALSNSMLEAMASGLPVIATRVSGSSVLREEPASGVVVDIGDTRQLAAAMRSLLGDAAVRTGLGENARRKFEQSFRLELHARAIGAIYQMLRANRGS